MTKKKLARERDAALARARYLEEHHAAVEAARDRAVAECAALRGALDKCRPWAGIHQPDPEATEAYRLASAALANPARAAEEMLAKVRASALEEAADAIEPNKGYAGFIGLAPRDALTPAPTETREPKLESIKRFMHATRTSPSGATACATCGRDVVNGQCVSCGDDQQRGGTGRR